MDNCIILFLEVNMINYSKPAERWEEAIPLGNGRLGAMAYGRCVKEIITMNDDTLWSGEPRNDEKFDTREPLIKAKALIEKKAYRAAHDYMNQTMLGEYTQTYMPMCAIALTMFHDDNINSYKRSLNTDSGIMTLSYKSEKVQYKRTYFCSQPDDVFIIKIESDTPSRINFSIVLDSLLKYETNETYDSLTVYGNAPVQVDPIYDRSETPILYKEDKGVAFATQVKIKTDGVISTNCGQLFVQAGSYAIIYVAGYTNFIDTFTEPNSSLRNPKTLCMNTLDSVMNRPFHKVIANHTEDFQKLTSQSYLDFGPVDETPINIRIDDNCALDASLLTHLVNFGKYLAVSSSRPGTQATHLQGIWNAMLQPPWASNFTVNINTEMNYWPLDGFQLSPCFEPFIDFVRDLSKQGTITAKSLACRGWTLHHNTDLWRRTIPTKNNASYAFWPFAGPWLTTVLVEHYRHHLDLDYLKSIFDILEGSMYFVVDWLYKDELDQWATNPSTSPENSYYWQNDKTAITKSSTMDMTIAWQLLSDYLEACQCLNIKNDMLQICENIIQTIPDYKIDDKGRILEWYDDVKERDLGHRHLSHLTGLYPNHRTKSASDKIMTAHHESLKFRIAHGGCNTSWSCAWGIALAARLKDRKLVDDLLSKFMKDSLINNGLSSHPPFQIDGNFGIMAAVLEMLVQVHENTIDVLPAMPPSLNEGQCQGIHTVNDLTFDIKWSNHQVTSLIIYANVSREVTIHVNQETHIITLNKNMNIII